MYERFGTDNLKILACLVFFPQILGVACIAYLAYSPTQKSVCLVFGY